MDKKKVLLQYQTPTVETVIVFDEVYTDQIFGASQDVGEEYPSIWD